MTDSTASLRISAIIPVHNGARYLREAVISVQTQTRPVAEIVIVDDASTDDTPAIIAALAADDPRIRHDRLPVQRGAGAARNHGVALATGDLLAFLDADDIWLREAVNSHLAALRIDTRLDISIGQVRQFFTPELEAELRQTTQLDDAPRVGLLPGGIMVRRATFERVGPFQEDVQVGEFVEWLIRARQAGIIESDLPGVTLLRRIHDRNLTRMHAHLRDYTRIVKAHLDYQRRVEPLPAVLRAIFDTRTVETAEGEALPLYAHVEENDCYVLQYFMRLRPHVRALEVGCAYGISAVALLAAMQPGPNAVYHLIDPYQAAHWKNVGLENIRRAGYADAVTFHPHPSEFALPRLAEAGERIDFAFIDGNHTFDHVLVDFFYVNRMLNVGGMAVFDDIQMESQKRLMGYIANYPAYERITVPNTLMVGGTRIMVANPGRFGVFRKVDEDRRSWSWFVDF